MEPSRLATTAPKPRTRPRECPRGGAERASLLALAFAMSLALPAAAWPADEAEMPCAEQLAAFADKKGLAFDPRRVTFGERWAAGGHEFQRVPGFRARLPAESCGAKLAVDLSEDCRVVKSWGEGSCKASYPPEFHRTPEDD